MCLNLDADIFTSIAFCNALHTLALILEEDLLNWLVEPLLVCKICFFLVLITINTIYTINHGGQKTISILIHHYTYSIMD